MKRRCWARCFKEHDMAFTSLVALASAETVTAVMVFSAIAEVGIAMTVMGAVTGDKNLTKTGAMVSMVGGLGGAAAGSGMFSGAAGEAAAGEVGAAAAGEAAAGAAAEGAAGAASATPAAEAVAATPGAQEAAMQGVGGADVLTA